jgi:nucleoside-diphosphate-sugar epimerase
MRVNLIGANGFVGTGLRLFLAAQPGVELAAITRDNYESFKGGPAEVTIDVSGNSKKFLSDQQPLLDMDLTVVHRLRTLRDFPAALQVHISSVDVYDDLTSQRTTAEDAPVNLAAASHYGLHKLLAEQVVQHYAADWLILRLAGMVGPGLRKNPVFDILNGQPLRIHPDSRYQFMHTGEVARILWELLLAKTRQQVFNVCGEGLISPREIAALAGQALDLTLLPPGQVPRIVDVNVAKLRKFTPIPRTEETIARFVSETIPASAKGAVPFQPRPTA